MTRHRAFSLLLGAALSCAPLSMARADEVFEQDFQMHLEKADISGAMALARIKLAESPGDMQAQFALGAAQFLDAVEGLGQGLYRHGLTHDQGDEALSGWLPGMSDLPFLRLPMPENPSPQPFSAESFRRILTEFNTDLQAADVTLSHVPAGQVTLPLYVKKVYLDFNGDGEAQPIESIPMILSAISGSEVQKTIPLIRFDESDVLWLRGYSHLLAGISDLLLAYDWRDAIDLTFHSAFPKSPLASAPLEDARQKMFVEYKRALAAKECGRPKKDLDSDELTPEEQAIWDRYRACERTRNALEYGGIADLVAFVHLFRWPVVEPERLLTARQHFLTMIALSRANWASILQETDDNGEWIPGPEQSSLFSNLQVTEEILSGWMSFLDQAEAVLEGRLLIAHWRFDKSQGLNIRSMLEEPETLDPILIISGAGALPYLETGPLAPGSTLDTGMDLLYGGMLAYFFWFN